MLPVRRLPTAARPTAPAAEPVAWGPTHAHDRMGAMSAEDYRPAGDIAPGWQVLVDGQWQQVDTVIETEQRDGARLVWLYFVEHRPAVARKSDLVRSRIPEQIHE
jgi:hypothetical protein